jgi:hypothetical protein
MEGGGGVGHQAELQASCRADETFETLATETDVLADIVQAAATGANILLQLPHVTKVDQWLSTLQEHEIKWLEENRPDQLGACRTHLVSICEVGTALVMKAWSAHFSDEENIKNQDIGDATSAVRILIGCGAAASSPTTFRALQCVERWFTSQHLVRRAFCDLAGLGPDDRSSVRPLGDIGPLQEWRDKISGDSAVLVHADVNLLKAPSNNRVAGLKV